MASQNTTNDYVFTCLPLYYRVCVYGGGSRRDQIGSVENGAEIIICTPGRLNDLIQAKVIDIATITYLVLDEGKISNIIAQNVNIALLLFS